MVLLDAVHVFVLERYHLAVVELGVDFLLLHAIEDVHANFAEKLLLLASLSRLVSERLRQELLFLLDPLHAQQVLLLVLQHLLELLLQPEYLLLQLLYLRLLRLHLLAHFGRLVTQHVLLLLQVVDFDLELGQPPVLRAELLIFFLELLHLLLDFSAGFAHLSTQGFVFGVKLILLLLQPALLL